MKDFSGIAMFIIKSTIVAVLFFSVVTMLLPNIKDIRQNWAEFSSKKENKALLLSFIQNPVALTISGERDIEKRNYADAALKFELAVGLLEMHGASPTVIQPYQTRFLDAKKMAVNAEAVGTP